MHKSENYFLFFGNHGKKNRKNKIYESSYKKNTGAH